MTYKSIDDPTSDDYKLPWERNDSSDTNNKTTAAPQREKHTQKAQDFHMWTFEANILLNEWCTANTAIVYSYMLSRYMFFKSQSKDYFESQDAIVQAVHLSESTIKRSIKALKDNGYLQIKSVKGQQYKKNVYVVIDKHSTYAGLASKPSTQASNKQQSHTSKTKYSHLYDDDDSDSPF